MMKRLFFLLTAFLTLSVGMWAQTQSVTYIDENGDEQTVDNVNVITNSTTTLNAGWYVVTGTDVRTGSLTCNGEVYLILADGAKLTATGGNDYQAGIEVSGEDNSLSIYGQAAQSGRLIATGGESAAGIGGGDSGYGSNITINGGTVSANGGGSAAGIGGGSYGSGSYITINGGTVWARGGNYGAAGIGGGNFGSGSNITINGGRVTATGGISGAGIGGGFDSSGSDIFMPVNYRIKAGGTFIHNDGADLADSLAGKQNVEAYPDELLYERNAAFAAISAAVEGISDEAILAMAAAGMEDVFQAEGSGDIEASKQKALSDLQYVISIYNSGKAAALGSMGEPCEECPSVEISDDNTTIKLYNPKKVEFMKNQSEE